MNDYLHLSPSGLLNSYLEGDLNPDQESHLFDLLASSMDLRNEMRDLLQIRSLVSIDSEELLPPAALRRRVFATVGLPIVSVEGVMSPSDGWYMNRAFISIASAVAGALLMLLAARIPELPSASSDGASVSIAPMDRSGHPVSEPREGIARENDGLRSRAVADLSTPTSGPYRQSSVRSLVRATEGHLAIDSLRGKDAASVPRVERIAIRDIVREDATVPASVEVRRAEPVRGLYHPAMPEGLDVAESREIFALSVTGFNSRSFPSVGQNSQSDPVFDNMSLGISRAVSSEVRIGVEIGQEAFPQEYTGTEEGRGVRYRQNPLLPWIALSGRLTPVELRLAPDLVPFGQVLLGATRVGPMGKAALGVEYKPDSRVRLAFGFEGGMLAYRYMNSTFFTRNIGVVYGISLSF